MTDPAVAPAPRSLATLPRVAALAVLAMGATALVGWAIGSRDLESLIPGHVTMKANTAVGLVGAAGALLLLDRRILVGRPWRVAGWVMTALVFAVGAATVAEYLFRTDLRVDQLLVGAGPEGRLSPTPGRMASVTAVELMLISLGLMALDAESRWRWWPSQFFAALVGAIAVSAVLGYAYGAIPVIGLGHGVQIALTTAVAFVLLAAGIVAQRPDSMAMRTLLARDAGGTMARRLLPVTVAVPLVLSGLRGLGEWSGLYGVMTGNAFVAVGTMIGFAVVIWATARALSEADRDRRQAENERHQLALDERAAQARAEVERSARRAAERARGDAEQARAQAEDAMREKAETLAMLDSALASAPVGFAFYDTDLRYMRVNAMLARVHGAEPGEHVGRRLQDVMPSVAHQVEGVMREVLATGCPVTDVEVMTEDTETSASPASPDRRRHWLASYYPMRLPNGRLLGLGTVVLDTTERRNLEDQLRQAQKLEAVGQLAGGVAHDFNNLLTVITSYADLLRTDSTLNGSRLADVDEIAKAAARATRLTKQLLAFSRKQVLQPKVLDLTAVVGDMEQMLRRLVGEDIEVSTRYAPGLGSVSADPGGIEQIVMNLAVNARDAMPAGGRLTIEVANVDLSAAHEQRHLEATPGPHVMLAVGDTGSGMDRATLSRIFEPFFTTKEVGKGTGLGLSTVYGIVKQSAAHIWVYSEPGEGTTFKIFFPRADGKVAASAPTDDAVMAGAGETILLVEDDDAVRTLAHRVLEGQGYSVLAARDGGDALDVAGRHTGPIHLVVTDVVMPRLNGRKLVEQLAPHRPAMRTLYMSGYTDDDIVRRGALDPDMAFIQKPFTPTALLRRVRDVLLKK